MDQRKCNYKYNRKELVSPLKWAKEYYIIMFEYSSNLDHKSINDKILDPNKNNSCYDFIHYDLNHSRLETYNSIGPTSCAYVKCLHASIKDFDLFDHVFFYEITYNLWKLWSTDNFVFP